MNGRLYTKYLPLKPRRRLRTGFWWLLVVLAAGLGTWFWWREHRGEKPRTKPAPASTSQLKSRPPLTPATTPRTNLAQILRQIPPPTPLVRSHQPGPLVQTNAAPVGTGFAPRPVADVFEAQLEMERLGICSGSLDGVLGSQTRAALEVFQAKAGLPETGQLDEATRTRLILQAPPVTNYTVVSNDLARLHRVPRTWLGKSRASRLDYESALELISEKGHAQSELIRQLNPTVDWERVTNGLTVQLPAAEYPRPKARAAWVRIHLNEKMLEAFDANTNLLVHFPCSIARSAEKRPLGQLRVTQIVHNPNYVFKPEIFPESEEGRALGRALVLPPGPNNPVGTTWIGLNRPGYGIHGTARPEEVGRTESHGCFRLANWNADYLAQLVGVGTPVWVER